MIRLRWKSSIVVNRGSENRAESLTTFRNGEEKIAERDTRLELVLIFERIRVFSVKMVIILFTPLLMKPKTGQDRRWPAHAHTRLKYKSKMRYNSLPRLKFRMRNVFHFAVLRFRNVYQPYDIFTYVEGNSRYTLGNVMIHRDLINRRRDMFQSSKFH